VVDSRRKQNGSVVRGGERVAAHVLAIRKSEGGSASLAGCFSDRTEAERFAEEENALAEKFGLPWRTLLREEGSAHGRA
jgi:nitrous oxide reductase accessory protein NosL